MVRRRLNVELYHELGICRGTRRSIALLVQIVACGWDVCLDRRLIDRACIIVPRSLALNEFQGISFNWVSW